MAGGNGHGRGNPLTYPASHHDVIAVAAMRDPSTRSAFSSTGDWIDVAAPDSSIMSTRPDAAFGCASSTSMAAPLMAGAVALLRSVEPDLDPAGVMDLLQDLSPAPPAIPDPAEEPAEPDEQETEPAPDPVEQLTRVPGLFSPGHYSR